MIKVGMSYNFSIDEFKRDFPSIELIKSLDQVKNYDLILFPGGEDVSPDFYDEHNQYSSCSKERDVYEWEVYRLATKLGKKMLGICRGSQFLNVMRGGSLWQDLTYQCNTPHTFLHTWDVVMNHKILSTIPEIINSTHHQGLKNYGAGLKIVAVYRDIPEITISTDNTILMLQFHPEMMNNCAELFSYIHDWVGGIIDISTDPVSKPRLRVATTKEVELKVAKMRDFNFAAGVDPQWIVDFRGIERDPNNG